MVDAPASSVNALVSTSSANDLRIGSNFDGTNSMSGSLDEFRVANKARGAACGQIMNIKIKNPEVIC